MNNKDLAKNIKWALESEKNKKEAIQNAIALITILNSNKKNITDEELKKIAGGHTFHVTADFNE